MFSNLFVVLYRDRKTLGRAYFAPRPPPPLHHRYNILLSAVETRPRESLIQLVGYFTHTHTYTHTGFLGGRRLAELSVRTLYANVGRSEEERGDTNFLYSITR